MKTEYLSNRITVCQHMLEDGLLLIEAARAITESPDTKGNTSDSSLYDPIERVLGYANDLIRGTHEELEELASEIGNDSQMELPNGAESGEGG